jgi:hypothetical protein
VKCVCVCVCVVIIVHLWVQSVKKSLSCSASDKITKDISSSFVITLNDTITRELYIQGVTGGMCHTSEGCSLC